MKPVISCADPGIFVRGVQVNLTCFFMFFCFVFSPQLILLSHEAFRSLKILSVYDRLFLRKAKFMFKVYHGLTPQYISENFLLRNEMDLSINLRSSAAGCFVPPLPKRECFKQSMRYSGCLIWNSLLNNVKQSQTAETFHNRCLKWLVQ